MRAHSVNFCDVLLKQGKRSDMELAKVIREDGTRRRFTYDLWCLVSFDNGFSMIRTAEEHFNP